MVVVALHDLGDHRRGPVDTDVFEVDDQIVEVGIGDIGVKDLPTPPRTVFVGIPDMLPGFVLLQTESLASRSRSDTPSARRFAP